MVYGIDVSSWCAVLWALYILQVPKAAGIYDLMNNWKSQSLLAKVPDLLYSVATYQLRRIEVSPQVYDFPRSKLPRCLHLEDLWSLVSQIPFEKPNPCHIANSKLILFCTLEIDVSSQSRPRHGSREYAAEIPVGLSSCKSEGAQMDRLLPIGQHLESKKVQIAFISSSNPFHNRLQERS
jgi:hypothetical protein